MSRLASIARGSCPHDLNAVSVSVDGTAQVRRSFTKSVTTSLPSIAARITRLLLSSCSKKRLTTCEKGSS